MSEQMPKGPENRIEAFERPVVYSTRISDNIYHLPGKDEQILCAANPSKVRVSRYNVFKRRAKARLCDRCRKLNGGHRYGGDDEPE